MKVRFKKFIVPAFLAALVTAQSAHAAYSSATLSRGQTEVSSTTKIPINGTVGINAYNAGGEYDAVMHAQAVHFLVGTDIARVSIALQPGEDVFTYRDVTSGTYYAKSKISTSILGRYTLGNTKIFN
jgi:hypothetical protein